MFFPLNHYDTIQTSSDTQKSQSHEYSRFALSPEIFRIEIYFYIFDFKVNGYDLLKFLTTANDDYHALHTETENYLYKEYQNLKGVILKMQSARLFLRRHHKTDEGPRGSVVDLYVMLQVGRSGVLFRTSSLEFFNWPNPFSHTMALGSIQSLKEISTRNLPGGKWRPARYANNLTSICVSTV
jgi:hypothetical protein